MVVALAGAPRRGDGRRRGRAARRRPAGSARGRRMSRRRSSLVEDELGRAWAMTRPLMSAAWWNRCAAQIRSWVVAMTVLPARASPSRTSIRSSWVRASTPVTGSSSRYRSGSAAIARARNTRRRWPPDSAPIWRSTASRHPDRLERRRDALAVGSAAGSRRNPSARSDPSSRPRRR